VVQVVPAQVRLRVELHVPARLALVVPRERVLPRVARRAQVHRVALLALAVRRVEVEPRAAAAWVMAA
jgi:hypothetical protein